MRVLLNYRSKERILKEHLVPAAVMLLLFEKKGAYHIVLNKRSQQVEYHKGEIAFPGGVYDEGDEDLKATALRETWEEMGIKRKDVAVLGELSELETSTNFRIAPFVGTFNYPYPYKPNPREVAEILEVPIKYLQDPANHRQELEKRPGYPSVGHIYHYQGHVIFGATARMLHQILELIG